jgi:methylated-DNA-[protein]-cysteine S-methyltransferase
MRSRLATARFERPIGPITVEADGEYLVGLKIAGSATAIIETTHPILVLAIEQLAEWFAGERENFDLPLLPLDSGQGATLRSGIAAIPYGTTMTYGALATQTGSIARAVGQACKTNPFPIIIPCHRVISSAGPEYYSAGGGPRTKTWLIDFEYDHLPTDQRTRML